MVGQTGARVQACVLAQPLASVAVRVKLAEVVLVGVPDSTPAELGVTPEGSEPLLKVKV